MQAGSFGFVEPVLLVQRGYQLPQAKLIEELSLQGHRQQQQALAGSAGLVSCPDIQRCLPRNPQVKQVNGSSEVPHSGPVAEAATLVS
jgi:hypothetical protein